MKPLDEISGGVGFILLIVGAFLALHLGPAHGAPYASLSIGRSSSPEFFDQAARYAFPDLATGGGDCCSLTHMTANSATAFRLALGQRYASGFGLEGSLSSLGRMDSAFDVSGAFWTALGRPGVQSGRCVESGRFRFAALTLAGTYRQAIGGGVAIIPKFGVSAVLVDTNTVSRCDFRFTDGTNTSVDQPQHTNLVSFVPMIGLEVRAPLRRGLDLTLDLEVRDRVLVAESVEARERGKGRIQVATLWVGVSFPF